MIKVIFLNALLIAVLCGCRDADASKIRKFIPGIYIRYSEHAFGKEYDTLSISLLDAHDEVYKIIRRWRYERRRDGQWLEPEYKVIITTGYYQRSKKYLWENGTGSIYVFDPRKKLLMNGSVNYQKL
jgi:hypothetical protein